MAFRVLRLAWFVGWCSLALFQPWNAVCAAGNERSTADTPPEVRQLLMLMEKPEVRKWLSTEIAGDQTNSNSNDDVLIQRALFYRWLYDSGERISSVVENLPLIPYNIINFYRKITDEWRGRSVFNNLIFIFIPLILGIISEQFVRLFLIKNLFFSIVDQKEAKLIHILCVTTLTSFIRIAVFSSVSITTMFFLSLREITMNMVWTEIVILLSVQLGYHFGTILFSPRYSHLRLIPMTDFAANFWRWRISIVIFYYITGSSIIIFAIDQGFPDESIRVITAILSFILLLIGLEIAIRWPPSKEESTINGSNRFSRKYLLSIYFILLWIMRVADADRLLLIAVNIVAVPSAIVLCQRTIIYLLSKYDTGIQTEGGKKLLATALGRGIRLILVLGVSIWLASPWGLGLANAAGDATGDRLLNNVLNALVVVMFTDFIWALSRTWIDVRIARSTDSRSNVDAGQEDLGREARLRTLLPILRNLLMMIVGATGLMMSLSALGVQIAPLVAGAGVVGVAVGLGAQTLVRDMISGLFYLLEDTFRVGEYIQTGVYRGTVESFSLRSVKLRHHRGPLFTVPFGALGAIQNMSRDWVIDKFSIFVSLETDVSNAKKIIKSIGSQLYTYEEFKPKIIETLKLQGVETISERGIELRIKMTTLPGEQFMIRRQALFLIKQAFDHNGIRIANPLVQVSTINDDDSAVAEAVAIGHSKVVRDNFPDENLNQLPVASNKI